MSYLVYEECKKQGFYVEENKEQEMIFRRQLEKLK